jgi:hypothetical protein
MDGAKDRRNFERWLATMPYVARWVRECLACGRRAIAADAPEKLMKRFLMQRVGTLALDESGLCEMCAAARLAQGDEGSAAARP